MLASPLLEIAIDDAPAVTREFDEDSEVVARRLVKGTQLHVLERRTNQAGSLRALCVLKTPSALAAVLKETQITNLKCAATP